MDRSRGPGGRARASWSHLASAALEDSPLSAEVADRVPYIELVERVPRLPEVHSEVDRPVELLRLVDLADSATGPGRESLGPEMSNHLLGRDEGAGTQQADGQRIRHHVRSYLHGYS